MTGSDPPRKGNRGRAAAQGNREALLAAARQVFAERGYDAPLSAIAQAAGVGQAVLYRHFPTRLSIAAAVFEDNLQRYEALVATPDATTLHRLWAVVCDDLVASAAFVEMTVEARRTDPAAGAAARFRTILEAAVPPALAAGVVPPDVTVDEYLLGFRMAYGIVVTSVGVSDAELRATLETALPRLSAAR